MIESLAFFEAKMEARKLLSSLGGFGTSAYVLGLAHIIDDQDMSEAERRQMAAMLRREILMAGNRRDPHRIAADALARAYQDLAALRFTTRSAGDQRLDLAAADNAAPAFIASALIANAPPAPTD